MELPGTGRDPGAVLEEVEGDPDATIFALESTDPDLDVYQVHANVS